MRDIPLLYQLQCASSDMGNLLEKWEDDLDADHTDWVCVDGEEGDHGSVYYRDDKGVLMYTRKSNGGDDDWIEMTEAGVRRGLEIIEADFKKLLLAQIKTSEGIDLT